MPATPTILRTAAAIAAAAIASATLGATAASAQTNEPYVPYSQAAGSINPDGSINRAVGVREVDKYATGTYCIKLDSPEVSADLIANATLNGTGAGTPVGSMIVVMNVSCQNDPNSFLVQTATKDGLYDLGFNFVVS